MNIKQVGYGPIILTIILVGLFIACAPKETKINSEKEVNYPGFNGKYLGKATTFGRVYKLSIDSSEYILFYDANNSCIVKHK